MGWFAQSADDKAGLSFAKSMQTIFGMLYERGVRCVFGTRYRKLRLDLTDIRHKGICHNMAEAADFFGRYFIGGYDWDDAAELR